MRNYAAAAPITIENPQAIIQASGCIDKDERAWSLSVGGAEKK
ncbi:MAG TPA: hypothetical protein VEK08_16370 [Planctomycetota bacterium]|nr:hypothetical protein [Planctomycetota bacterium]